MTNMHDKLVCKADLGGARCPPEGAYTCHIGGHIIGMTGMGQKGMALIFSLIFLISLTVIALASVRTGVMELKIANNLEEEMDAFELSQAAVDAIASSEANFTGASAVGVEQNVDLSTTDSMFDYPTDADTSADETLTATVTRTSEDCMTAPRLSAAQAVSATKFIGISYKVSAVLDKTAAGGGQASIHQGFLTLGPSC